MGGQGPVRLLTLTLTLTLPYTLVSQTAPFTSHPPQPLTPHLPSPFPLSTSPTPSPAQVYLFFSVNASGQFSGMAQMESALDYTNKFGCWAQDKRRRTHHAPARSRHASAPRPHGALTRTGHGLMGRAPSPGCWLRSVLRASC